MRLALILSAEISICMSMVVYVFFTILRVENAFLRGIFIQVQVTMAALGELFQAARGIMGWLGDCAKVSRSVFQLYYNDEGSMSNGIFIYEF